MAIDAKNAQRKSEISNEEAAKLFAVHDEVWALIEKRRREEKKNIKKEKRKERDKRQKK